MEPSVVLKLIFPAGEIGRMQVYIEDTSNEALQAEIDRSSFSIGRPVSWERTTTDDPDFKRESE